MISKEKLNFKNFIKGHSEKDIAKLMSTKSMNYKSRGISFFERKYDVEEYAGFSMLSKLVYYENKLVAHCAGFPMKAKIKGEIYKTASIGDLIVDSSCRGLGVASYMIKGIMDLAKTEKLPFIYTVPNKVSNDIFIKLGWKLKSKNTLYSIKIRTIPFLKIFNKLGLTNYYYFLFYSFNRKKNINRNKFNLKNSLIVEGFDGIIRDSSYYNYKTYGNNFLYEFKNGKIWFKIDDGLVIGDIYVNENSDINALMKEFTKFSKNSGIHQIKLFTTHQGKLHTYFEKNHHTKDSGLNLLVYSFDNKLNLDNWYTNSADYNTF